MIFNEGPAAWVQAEMDAAASVLRMSTVNYAETLMLVRSLQPHLFKQIQLGLLSTSIRFEPPTKEQAEIAADARHRLPSEPG